LNYFRFKIDLAFSGKRKNYPNGPLTSKNAHHDPFVMPERRIDPKMQRLALSLMALILLTINICGCAQDNPLGKATAQLFNDQPQVKQVSFTAWKTARDEGPRAALKKSSAHLQKAIAASDKTPEKAAPEAFAAWWYNIAAQYWSENAAKKPEGQVFITPIEGIIKARRDLERALGWDEGLANRVHWEAYQIMDNYK
jgi:hypothetical protein